MYSRVKVNTWPRKLFCTATKFHAIIPTQANNCKHRTGWGYAEMHGGKIIRMHFQQLLSELTCATKRFMVKMWGTLWDFLLSSMTATLHTCSGKIWILLEHVPSPPVKCVHALTVTTSQNQLNWLRESKYACVCLNIVIYKLKPNLFPSSTENRNATGRKCQQMHLRRSWHHLRLNHHNTQSH